MEIRMNKRAQDQLTKLLTMTDDEHETDRIAGLERNRKRIHDYTDSKPEEIRVYTNLVMDEELHWADIFLSLSDNYIFIFTIHTDEYVKAAKEYDDETIVEGEESFTIDTKPIRNDDIIECTKRWAKGYYPALEGTPIVMECEEQVNKLMEIQFQRMGLKEDTSSEEFVTWEEFKKDLGLED